jgi:chitinase
MRFEEAPKIILPSYYNQSGYGNKKIEEDKNAEQQNMQLEPEHLKSKLQDILDDDSGSLFKESSEDSYNPANFGRSKSK